MATDYDAMLQKANQGDRQALTAIYDAFYTPLYRYVYRQVEGEETARDLTSDVFHRFLQAIQKGTGPDQYLQAWLYRVAPVRVSFRSSNFSRSGSVVPITLGGML